MKSLALIVVTIGILAALGYVAVTVEPIYCRAPKIAKAETPPPTPEPPPQNEVGPMPPVAVLTGPTSARLGEMVVMRADKTTGVDYCKWSIEPTPASYELVDITEGSPKNRRVVGAGREVHWSSVNSGVYIVSLAIAGPGGLETYKTRVAYGTLTDDNVLAPAEENQQLAARAGTFDGQLVAAIRAVRSQNKAVEVVQVAEAFDSVAEQITEPNPHITSPDEASTAIRRECRNRLGANYSKWIGFLDTFSDGIREAGKTGQITTLPQFAQVCGETAELLRNPK